jgi:hypothetical protein
LSRLFQASVPTASSFAAVPGDLYPVSAILFCYFN